MKILPLSRETFFFQFSTYLWAFLCNLTAILSIFIEIGKVKENDGFLKSSKRKKLTRRDNTPISGFFLLLLLLVSIYYSVICQSKATHRLSSFLSFFFFSIKLSKKCYAKQREKNTRDYWLVYLLLFSSLSRRVFNFLLNISTSSERKRENEKSHSCRV